MNIYDSIEADLRIIANESKKKHPNIEEAAENIIKDIKTSSSPSTDRFIDLLNSVKQTGTVKTHKHAINILQKLLSSQLIDSISVISALNFLSTAIGISEESLQLKGLQTIMLILNPSFVILTEDLIREIWKISIPLISSKNTQIKNTASASLRQLADVIFEKFYVSRSEDSYESKSNLVCTNLIISFINENLSCSLNTVLNKKLKIEGISLLINIISNKNFAEFIEDSWKKLLEQTLNLVKLAFTQTIEEGYTNLCISLSALIIHSTQEFSSVYPLMSYFEQRYPDWVKVSSLKAIHLVLQKPSKLEDLAKNNLLIDIIKSCSSAVTTLSDQDANVFKLKTRVIIEILNSLIESLSDFCTKNLYKLNDKVISDSLIEYLLSNTWKPLLSIISYLLSVEITENQLQSVLSILQNLVNFTGTFSVIQGRESFISSLTKYTKPSSVKLSYKELMSFKTLLNIAHGLHSILDMKSWHRILNNLQVLDSFLMTCKSEDDTEILKTALDSLFTTTELWQASCLAEFIGALGQVALESMEQYSSSDKKAPVLKVFAIDKLVTVTLSNISRVPVIWNMVSVYLDCSCHSKSKEIKKIGTKSLKKILIQLFKHYTDRPPSDEDWAEWQKTLLVSIKNIAVQKEPAAFRLVLNILQSFGGQLDKSGWEVVLSILAEFDTDFHSDISFKCLSLIVNDYIDSDGLWVNLEKLVGFINKFAKSHDLNLAVRAIGLFWNLADYIGKSEKLETYLFSVLAKLKEFSQDYRPEIRHSAVHSIHLTLTTYGFKIPQNLWKKIMETIILELLKTVSDTYLKNASLTEEVPILEPQGFFQTEPQEHPRKKGKNLQIAIPTDSAYPLVSETPKFSGTIEVLIETKPLIRESIEKQWEETYYIYTQNLGKLFRIYLLNLEKLSEEVFKIPELKRNWDVLMLRLKEGLDHGTANILTAVLKAVKEMLSCAKVSTLFFYNWDSSWEIFSVLCNRLQVSYVSIPYDLISVIVEDLSLIYFNEHRAPYQDKCLNTLFLLLNGLIEATKLDSPPASCKLLPGQSQIFNFLDKISLFLLKKNANSSAYLRFLLRFCKYDGQDSHSDGLCRRSLQSLESLIKSEPTCIVPVINEILFSYEILMNSRYDLESLHLMSVSCKGAEPLYCFSVESFIVVLPYIMKFNCWTKLLKILNSLLFPEDKALEKLGKSALDKMMANCGKINKKMIQVISENLVPASMSMQSDIQNQLILILGNGCSCWDYELDEESFMLSCLAALFELSRSRDPTQDEEDRKPVAEDHLYLKIAKKTVPVLVSKCKEVLGKFSQLERESGAVIAKNKEKELVRILKMLKDLNIPEGLLNNGGRKGHLQELYLNLCELVVLKEPDVVNALREVLIEFYVENIKVK